MEVKNLGIKAVEPGVLDILLEEPAPWILEILAHPVSYPLHPSSLDDPRRAPVNGAYTLDEWIPRSTLRLKRNPEYYAAIRCLWRRLNTIPLKIPQRNSPATAPGNWISRKPFRPAASIGCGRTSISDLAHPSLPGQFLAGPQSATPALGQSADLRRALALAIDRETLVRVVLGAGEMPAWSVVPPGVSAYEPALMKESGWTQEQREAEAVRLFKKSGFGGREPLMLELRYNTSGVHRRVAVAVSAMWKQVLGVLTELINEEWKVFVNNRRMGVVTEVFPWRLDCGLCGPLQFSGSVHQRECTEFTTFYANPSFDELMKSASTDRWRGTSGTSRPG